MTVLEEKPLPVKKHLPNHPKHIHYRGILEKRRGYLTAKRVFDVLFSSIVILFVLSWLIPIIAALIKLSSKGPAFFIQKRVGFLGKSFHCIKFRTMVVNREANSKQAEENDPRITRIGRLLRISNIDELPQFFNVLMGHMSIVGPRPHMHSDCKDFSVVVNNYKFRNITKPGITGLAQVKGCRGPAKDIDSIFRRYQWDSFYVRNQGFRLDLRIIGLTIASTVTAVFSILSSASEEKEETISYQLQTNELLN